MEVDRVHSRSFADALRLFVGQGKRFTVEAVAEASGVTVRNILAYRGGECGATFENAMAIIAVMPPEFAQQALKSSGIIEVKKAEPDAKACARRLNTRLAQHAARLAEMLEDGRIDHQEEAELRRSLPELQAKITRYLASTEPHLSLVHLDASESRQS